MQEGILKIRLITSSWLALGTTPILIHWGFQSSTSVESIDKLLSGGGLKSMMGLISTIGYLWHWSLFLALSASLQKKRITHYQRVKWHLP